VYAWPENSVLPQGMPFPGWRKRLYWKEEGDMRTNVGQFDRVVRLVLALLILGAYFLLDQDSRNWALLGLIPLATALAGWDPLYSLLGIDTRKLDLH
jgi:hypothetical protein